MALFRKDSKREPGYSHPSSRSTSARSSPSPEPAFSQFTKHPAVSVDVSNSSSDISAIADDDLHTPISQGIPLPQAKPSPTVGTRHRSSSMSQRLKHLFAPHLSKRETLDSPTNLSKLQPLQTSGFDDSRSVPSSPAIKIDSAIDHNEKHLSSAVHSAVALEPVSPVLTPVVASGKKTPISAKDHTSELTKELSNSMAKLSMRSAIPENSLDDVIEEEDEESDEESEEEKRRKEKDRLKVLESDGNSEPRSSSQDNHHRHRHHHHHHHNPGSHEHLEFRSSPFIRPAPRHRATISASIATSPKSTPVSPNIVPLEGSSPPIPDVDSGFRSDTTSSANTRRRHGSFRLLKPSSVDSSPVGSRSNSGSESRSGSTNGSRNRSNSDALASHDSFLNSLKHSQSINYSTAHLFNQKVFKLKSSRVRVSADGLTHEHDYTKFKTQPIKPNRGLFGWMKRKDADDESYTTVEHSISLLPDSYSQQLMELKSDPTNYRWNYDDTDDDDDDDEADEDKQNGGKKNGSSRQNGFDLEDEEEDEDDDDNNDFDDEADDELIEPIIGKEQLKLINVMMDKIEHPEKFKDRMRAKGTNKKPLIEKYGRIEGFIGKGSYGTVSISSKIYNGDKKRKVYFAIKQLKRRNGESLHHFGNRVTSEFMISSCLTHQAIINVYDLMVDPVSMTYSQVMEFIPCGDLFSLISATNGLSVIECDCFFKQILNAITYLHSVGISHNDLKVENLLLTKKGQLKIIDFGTSAVFKTAWEDKVQFSRGPCGSERYVSPEQFDKKHSYDPRLADVWSLGVIYLVMLYGNYCWDVAKDCDERYDEFLDTRAKFDYSRRSKINHKQFKLIRKGMFNQIESINSGPYTNSRKYVLYNVLNPNPKYRMRTYQIWQSDWIKSFRVCEAGRGYLSYNDYIELALQTAHACATAATSVPASAVLAKAPVSGQTSSQKSTLSRESSRRKPKKVN